MSEMEMNDLILYLNEKNISIKEKNKALYTEAKTMSADEASKVLAEHLEPSTLRIFALGAIFNSNISVLALVVKKLEDNNLFTIKEKKALYLASTNTKHLKFDAFDYLNEHYNLLQDIVSSPETPNDLKNYTEIKEFESFYLNNLAQYIVAYNNVRVLEHILTKAQFMDPVFAEELFLKIETNSSNSLKQKLMKNNDFLFVLSKSTKVKNYLLENQNVGNKLLPILNVYYLQDKLEEALPSKGSSKMRKI